MNITFRKATLSKTAVVLLTIMAAGCANRNVEESRSVTDRDSAVIDFPLPEISDSVKAPEARIRLLLQSYWTRLDWKSAQAKTDTAFMEQGMVNFLELMQRTDSTTATEAYRNFLRSVPDEGRPMAEHLIQMSGEYLFTPDSPVYNPQVYASMIDALLAENVPGEAAKTRYLSQHAEVMKNRPGTRATDFEMVTRHGTKTSLSLMAKNFARTAPKDAKIILFFYDPDCEACELAEKKLMENEALNEDIKAGKVLFVAVDPYGTEWSQWKVHADQELPTEWKVAYSPDGEVDAEGLYMLKASPTIYVLKPDLTVLTQDARL